MSVFKSIALAVEQALSAGITVNIDLQDDDLLKFGTGDDVTLGWDGSQLEFLPASDDAGAVNIGDGTTDVDLKVFLGSTTEYAEFDVGNSRVRLNVPLYLDNNTGAWNSALLMGAGTNADRCTTSSANTKFIEFRLENTATSGDNRGIYNRLYLGGAGGGGESLRSFTTVDGVAAGTAHGAHISLNFADTSSSITGQGIGMRATLHIPNYALSGGTYAAAQSELYFDGDGNADISGTTAHSIHRFVVDGNAAGQATAENAFEFVNIPSGTAAADMLKTDKHAGDSTDGLRCLVNGSVKYIMLAD